MRVNTQSWRLPLSAALAAMLLVSCGGGSEEAQAPSAHSAAAEPLADTATSAVPRAAPARSARPNSLAAAAADGTKRPSPAAARQAASKIYIVQLAEPPVSANAATKPARGKKIDRRDSRVASYVSQLRARHDAVARSVSARKLYSYNYVFNGFAAELNEGQVQRLRATKGVLAVTKDQVRKLNTVTTPGFLGLSGPQGFWAKTGATGENVVIGVIDGGVWPEALSFSDKANAQGVYTADMSGSGYAPLAGWAGQCVEGVEFTTANCNNKLIGARYFNDAWGGDEGISYYLPWEYNSPRDHGGHGTHTASTAGGNANVPATGPAAIFGSISGMAPRARIAAYKVCWDDLVSGACFSSDSVAAIDQAVADGVDVINFSVSGSTDVLMDPVELAFMNAADAGIFVAVSAGNDGPDASTVNHPSPWLTTVAAGTHPRVTSGTVTLGNSASYTGASVNGTNLAATTLIDASQAGKDGADPAKVARCYAASDNGDVAVLDPAKVAGKVVVCERGVTARVDKSKAVFEAGGVGMILVNVTPNDVVNDFHSVPTVHLHHTDRTAVQSYATGGGTPTAAIPPASIVTNAPAPHQSDFSSRGPTFAARSDLLKPDITAPGTDVLAAVAPPGNSDRSFDLYSGTSMASPHIAGIAALFKQVRPTWSPMMIKSALMTTATDLLDTTPGDATAIFGQGAGHVQPQKALNPGLVFDSDIIDWLGFLCTTELGADYCAYYGIPLVQPRNLNVPSIAVSSVAGTQSATRRVRNVGGKAATYTPKVTGLDGFDVSVTPSRLKLTANSEGRFTVKFTRKTAAINEYAGGQLTWTDGDGHTVRMPLVAQPVALAAPAEVNGDYTVSFGYTGEFHTDVHGLVAAAKAPNTISTGQEKTFSVVVPAGTAYARFALFDSDVSIASDLDMTVFKGATQVGASGGATAQESVNLVNPEAGTYTVKVQGYDVPHGPASFNLYSWSIPAAEGGDMTVKTATAATLGATAAVTVRPCPPTTGKGRTRSCSLPAGNKYLGMIGYSGSKGMPAPTIVFIE